MSINRLLHFAVLSFAVAFAHSLHAQQKHESFHNLTASGIRYESGSFVGDEELVWEFEGARSVRATYNLSDTSIGFGTDSLEYRYLEGTLPAGGLSRLRFMIGPYFSGGVAADRSVSVWINGNFEGSFWLESMQGPTVVDLIELEFPDPVRLRLEALGPRQLVLDKIEWWPLSANENPPPGIPEPEEPSPKPETPPLQGFNPWSSDEDFLTLLESLLPGTDGFDPGLWQFARFEGRLDRMRALEIWFQLTSVKRLEILFRTVRLLEGRYPDYADWSRNEQNIPAFVEYLDTGDLTPLVEFIIEERPFARMRIGLYDLDDPGPFLHLLWFHWSGRPPTAQQLVQMQYRIEDLMEQSGSVEEALFAFLSAFISRTRVNLQPWIHQQPAAVFEMELVGRMLDQICGIDSFEHWDGLDASYRYADIPVQLWLRLSHPTFLRDFNIGPLGATLLSPGIGWHSRFGWMHGFENQFKWIHLGKIGWVWLQPQLSGEGFWLWQPENGWFWTSESVFPWAIRALGKEPFRLPFSN